MTKEALLELLNRASRVTIENCREHLSVEYVKTNADRWTLLSNTKECCAKFQTISTQELAEIIQKHTFSH